MPVIFAWRRWFFADRQASKGGRKVLFIFGLSVASLALIWYCLLAVYMYWIGGFGENFAAVLRWTRPGFWLSAVAAVLTTAGRGRSRVLALVSSLVLAILWAIPVWGM